MPVENVTHINHLNPDWPTSADFISEGDDHIRGTKKALKNSLPNIAGAVTATHGELNQMVGVTSPVQGQINSKANKAGDSYSGNHSFSGASGVSLPENTSVGQVTSDEIARLAGVGSSIQTQLNSKAATTVTDGLQAQINTKAAKTTTDDLQSQINSKASQSTADNLQSQINAKAAKGGDTYAGTHDFAGATVMLATPAIGDSSSKAATTAFVAATAMSSSLPGQTGNAGKVLGTDGTTASWVQVAPPPYASATISRTNGVVTSITETVGGTPRVTTITRSGGVVTQIAVAHNGVTRTETLTRTNGQVTGITVTET